MARQDSPTPRPSVARLRDRPTADVIIVGGGINGIATFRELALQGVDVMLVERGDFVSGASSASSHMVHGGVRYLENGELRLVREAVQERNRLLRNAPHYVAPLETTIPIFKTFSGVLTAPFRLLVSHGRGKPRERGALLIKIGLVIYDTFSRGGGRVPRHRFHGRERSLRALPRLNPRIKYTATYFDASMHDPERLALDVLGDGIAAGQQQPGALPETATARAANYVSAVGFADGGVQLRDELTGDEFSLTARVVINTSGPWTDQTNAALGRPTHYMGGTKGSHIVFDHPELLAATGGREMFFEHSDGRIVLIYPLKGRVMVGTTDIDADPGEPSVCTDAEVDYFFDLIPHVFPSVTVRRDQIVYSFSGIRPLPRHDDTAPGFVSRDYRIEHGWLGGVRTLSLVGGKWTTFRALAEHLGDETLQLLGATRTVSTRATMIGGGAGFPRDRASRRIWIAKHGGSHDPVLVSRLLDRYGTRATEVLATLPAAPEELASAPGYSAEELAHLAGAEGVVHLDDLLLRRTSIAFVGGMTADTLREVAAAIAPALGWDAATQEAEVARTTELLRTAHRVELGARGLVAQH
ncbi:glycerol-3-phosphate dehydrogenase/oxidase [Leucobacter luti]|uniref:Glycerol-3-phosphate dehydrogenase n=1 Tax=Leucobacter luti TaxID=340320 RepID=A0A4Q7TUR3_9MICO|nr:glycerol-3-phosphate dehydrogenase/oxidase [Leucobacter luti]MBL3698231.1 glycerol-3-phosphate dehydrogenase/oxidase [Leucobacter luti]RZT64686.1 glycerol-3-phosphate dehydrogenase [Leucobacter luti]